MLLGGGYTYFLCSSLFGGRVPILTIIVFRWVETTNQEFVSRGCDIHDSRVKPGDLSYADGFGPRWDSFGRLFERLGASTPMAYCPGPGCWAGGTVGGSRDTIQTGWVFPALRERSSTYRFLESSISCQGFLKVYVGRNVDGQKKTQSESGVFV